MLYVGNGLADLTSMMPYAREVFGEAFFSENGHEPDTLNDKLVEAAYLSASKSQSPFVGAYESLLNSVRNTRTP